MSTAGPTSYANPLLEPLTKREREILELLAEGLTSGEIAERLTLAVSSVRWYVQQIYGKLGVNNKRQAITRAGELGLIHLNPTPPPERNPPEPRPGPALPTGTVTFLFTDIVDSTPLWEKYPRKMAEALAIHNQALRQAFESQGGQVFKVVGDSFQVVFPTALQALQAAIIGQFNLNAARWNRLGELRVRMGLHTGVAALDPVGEEYEVSHTKNRVARIMSAAYGGQILLSQETKDLVERSLPEGAALKDLGEHHLKGMELREHLYQGLAAGLTANFPSLASAARLRHNLPIELTSFIGREEVITQLLRLVGEHPLVTLTGVGGTGKTRLALKTAERTIRSTPPIFPDGVWLVELASIANGDIVPQGVLSAIGLSEVPGLTPTAVLAEFLCGRRVLLILDNCEHVIGAASRLAHDLVQACSGVHILATSREILEVEGEVPFRCSSLTLPNPQGIQSVVEAARSEAVRLFVERAERVSPGFALSEENARLVAHICQRLDGIPLAIELAAARVRLLSVEQIAARLDNVFRLLTGGSRTDLPRHQTLKALIDWSYNLLSENERLLFQHLSVFSGGWTLEAAEAVCADPSGGQGQLPAEEILELLGHLLDKSLVEIAPKTKSGLPRYRMLETIRQYAREELVNNRLIENEGVAVVRERHLDYYLALCLQADQELRGRRLRLWREKLDDELDNLRLAMEWAERGSFIKGLRLATALYLYWFAYREEEGITWLERLLAAEASTPTADREDPARSAARGRALNVLTYLGGQWGLDVSSTGSEAVAIFEALGEGYQIDRAISLSLWSEKDFQENQALFRQAGDPWCIANIALWPLINENTYLGNLAAVRAYLEESLAINQNIEYLTSLKNIFTFLWFVELLEGNQLRAKEYMRAAIEWADAAGETGIGPETMLSGCTALFQGDYAEAEQVFQNDLANCQEKGIHQYIGDVFGLLARTAWACGEYDRAGKYAGDAVRLPGRVSEVSLRTARYVLGQTAIAIGQYEQAFDVLKEALLHWNFKNGGFLLIPIQLVLQAFGILAAAQIGQSGQARRAAVLFGAQDFINKNLMNVMTPPEREAYRQSLDKVRAVLDVEEFNDAWAEGRAMTTGQAVEYALYGQPAL